jgi:hypothetical protein
VQTTNPELLAACDKVWNVPVNRYGQNCHFPCAILKSDADFPADLPLYIDGVIGSKAYLLTLLAVALSGSEDPDSGDDHYPYDPYSF